MTELEETNTMLDNCERAKKITESELQVNITEFPSSSI